MAEEKEMFEIETISDKETKVLCVKDFDVTLAKAKEILDSHPVFEILTDEDKKAAKALRASFNKVVKAIDRRRIDDVEDFTAQFTEQCNTIKAMFDEHQKELGAQISAYEEAHKDVVVAGATVTKFTATLKFTDPKVKDKLTKFAIANGCELTIK